MNRSLPVQNTRRLTQAIALRSQVEPAGFRIACTNLIFQANGAKPAPLPATSSLPGVPGYKTGRKAEYRKPQWRQAISAHRCH